MERSRGWLPALLALAALAALPLIVGLWSARATVAATTGESPTEDTAAAAAAPKAAVGLFAEGSTVAPGGSVAYHVAYRFEASAEAEDEGKARVRRVEVTLPDDVAPVRLPEGAVVGADGSVAWEVAASASSATGEGAEPGEPVSGIERIEVRVSPEAEAGALLEAQARLLAGAEGALAVVVESAVEPVRVGPEDHQPFFQGYPDGMFGPSRPITRAEAAAVAVRIASLSGPDPRGQEGAVPGEPTFRDTPPEHWAYRHVEAAVAAGMMRGYPDGTFRPDRPITRAEFLAVLLRAQAIPAILAGGIGSLGPAAGVLPDHWAGPVLSTGLVLGLLSGDPGGALRPDDAVRRDEAAALLARSLGRGPLVEGETAVTAHFPDVPPGGWAFGWVEEVSKEGHRGVHEAVGRERLVRYLETEVVW